MTMNKLNINPELVQQLLVQFIREHTEKHGFEKVVVGLSGGLDSTVSAYLAVEALGRFGVLGVFLPHKQSNAASLKDAKLAAEELKIESRLVEITPFVEAYKKEFPDITHLQLGNVMARCRMIALYQISAAENALVLGTSNKSEILLGYGTLHGDLAAAFWPLGDLYKTQIRQLAEHLQVPQAILDKPPSADLWEGQSDEGELGLTYAEADRLFIRWIDGRYTREELIDEGFAPEFVNKVLARVESQQFKRTLPPIPKISNRTIGGDFLYPRDWKK